MEQWRARLHWVAILVIALGVLGFEFAQFPTLGRWLWLGASVALALPLMWFSERGQAFVVYVQDSVVEAKKIVWPDKKRTWQVTAMVGVFVVVVGLFLWIVDSLLGALSRGLLGIGS